MHIKVMSPGDWNFGVKPAELVKYSSRGLVGDDLTAFIKRAGHAFDNVLSGVKIEKDEVPLHVIALGAYEAYGLNRNGDGFTCDTCRKQAHTFVKMAKWFRNHKNKPGDPYYGVIKAAVFNEAMKRIELLVALNAEQSAADRNGGFVADKELEKIASGKDIGTSMACKVAYDVCLSCGNKARHRSEYCDENSCVGPHGEKRGGCKHHLTDVAEDGFMNGVDNPNAEWFDDSFVTNPADFIAYGGVADYLQKAASGEVLGGAALAEAWGLRPGLYLGREADAWTTKQAAYRLVERLAEEESGWGSPDEVKRQAARVMAQQHELDLGPLRWKSAADLRALVERRTLLTPTDFLRWFAGEEGLKQAAAVEARLPGVYGRLAAEPTLGLLIRDNPFEPGPAASGKALTHLDKQAGRIPTTPEGFRHGLYLAAIRNTEAARIKTASAIDLPASAETERLARTYALYKLAYLVALPDSDQPTAIGLAVAQNYVSRS